jgi:hypothetical protein
MKLSVEVRRIYMDTNLVGLVRRLMVFLLAVLLGGFVGVLLVVCVLFLGFVLGVVARLFLGLFLGLLLRLLLGLVRFVLVADGRIGAMLLSTTLAVRVAEGVVFVAVVRILSYDDVETDGGTDSSRGHPRSSS